MQELKDVLVDNYGLDLALAGWTLIDVFGVSADGCVFAGYGTNPSGQPEAWIARIEHEIPEPAGVVLLLGGLAALARRRRARAA